MPKACTQVFAPESLSIDLEAFESLQRIKRHKQKLLAAKLRKNVPSFAEASAAAAAAVAALNSEQQEALIAARKKQRGEAKAARKKELREKRDHERQLKLDRTKELESKKEELVERRAQIEAKWKDEQAQIAAIHENLNALNEQKHEAVLKLKQVLHTEVTLRRQSSNVQQINTEQQAGGQPLSPYPMPNMMQQQNATQQQAGGQPASPYPMLNMMQQQNAMQQQAGGQPASPYPMPNTMQQQAGGQPTSPYPMSKTMQQQQAGGQTASPYPMSNTMQQQQAGGQPALPYPMPNMMQQQQQGNMSFEVPMQHPSISMPPGVPVPFLGAPLMLQSPSMPHMAYVNSNMQHLPPAATTSYMQQLSPAATTSYMQQLPPAATTSYMQHLQPVATSSYMQHLPPVATTSYMQQLPPTATTSYMQQLPHAATTSYMQHLPPVATASYMQQLPPPLHPIPSPRAPLDPPPLHPSSYIKPPYLDSPHGIPLVNHLTSNHQPPPQPPQPPPQPSPSPSGFGASVYPPLPTESKPALPREPPREPPKDPPSRPPSVGEVARREPPIRPPLGEVPMPSSSPRPSSLPTSLPRRGSFLSSRDLRAEGEIEPSELTSDRHAPAERVDRASDDPYSSRSDSAALRRISPERRRSSHDLRYDLSDRPSERRPEPDPRGLRGASSLEPRRGSDTPGGRQGSKPSHSERERSDRAPSPRRRPIPSSSDSSSSDEGEISEEGEVKFSPRRSSSEEDGIDPSCIRPTIRTAKGPPPQMLPPHLSRSSSAGHSPREPAGGSWSHPPPPPFGSHLPPHLKHGDGFSSRGSGLPSPMDLFLGPGGELLGACWILAAGSPVSASAVDCWGDSSKGCCRQEFQTPYREHDLNPSIKLPMQRGKSRICRRRSKHLDIGSQYWMR
eukprot:gene7856-1063_t